MRAVSALVPFALFAVSMAIPVIEEGPTQTTGAQLLQTFVGSFLKQSQSAPAQEDTGGLVDSTCDAVGADFEKIHDYIPLVLKQSSAVTGDYKCIAAWRETTSEEAAWVLCNVGGTVYAVMVAENGPYTRVHLPKDPNAEAQPVFSGGNSNPLLNKYKLVESKPASSFDITIPARVQAAATAPVDTEDDEPQKLVLAEDDGPEELAVGNIPLTEDERAAMPTLLLTEEQLASAPPSWDVRNKVSGCLAFQRFNQGTCGSCWAWGAAAMYSAKLCWVTKGKVNVALSEESLLDCAKSTSWYIKDAGGKAYMSAWMDPASQKTRDMCQGGNIVGAMAALLSRGGVVDRTCNPYDGKWTAGSCGSVNSSCRQYTLGKDKKIYAVSSRVSDIKAALTTYGPAEISGKWNKNTIAKYRRGVFSNCGAGSRGHSMGLFGYGTDNGTPYWLIANSHGANWGENGYLRMISGRNCLHYEKGVATVILDAGSFNYCSGKPACRNGGSFNRQCKCSCTGYWQGSTCNQCNIACKNGGTKQGSTCTCSCPSGYFGETCASGVTWKWTASNAVKLSWTIASGWQGKARISSWADAARSTYYSNGMNGQRYYETSSSSGSTTVRGNGKQKFFNFDEWLGKNEFGSDKGYVKRKVNVGAYPARMPTGAGGGNGGGAHSPHSHSPHRHSPHSHSPHSHSPKHRHHRHATKPTSGSCADGNPNINLGGSPATCADLMSYCDHGSLGAQIRRSCPTTCGSNGCAKRCADSPSSGFTGHTCSSLKTYCDHSQYGSTIRKNCPKTCGVCS